MRDRPSEVPPTRAHREDGGSDDGPGQSGIDDPEHVKRRRAIRDARGVGLREGLPDGRVLDHGDREAAGVIVVRLAGLVAIDDDAILRGQRVLDEHRRSRGQSPHR